MFIYHRQGQKKRYIAHVCGLLSTEMQTELVSIFYMIKQHMDSVPPEIFLVFIDDPCRKIEGEAGGVNMSCA